MPTVTFQIVQGSRHQAEPAYQQTGGNLNNGSGAKPFFLDNRLETARPVFESQPSNMIVTVSKASLAMHSSSKAIRLKKSGVSKLETDDLFFPKNIDFKPKFDMPKDLLEDEESKTTVTEFEKELQDAKLKLKALVVKQAKRTMLQMEESRRGLFISSVSALAGHCATYQRNLHINPVDAKGLTDGNIGHASLHCYFNGLENDSPLFGCPSITKEDFMPILSKATTTLPTGLEIFTQDIRNDITKVLNMCQDTTAPTSAQLDLRTNIGATAAMETEHWRQNIRLKTMRTRLLPSTPKATDS
jgi:hypothetical protein